MAEKPPIGGKLPCCRWQSCCVITAQRWKRTSGHFTVSHWSFFRYITAKRDFLSFSEHSGDSPRPAAAGIVFQSPFLSVTLLEHIIQAGFSAASLVARSKASLGSGVGGPGDHMTTARVFFPNERCLMGFRGLSITNKRVRKVNQLQLQRPVKYTLPPVVREGKQGNFSTSCWN